MANRQLVLAICLALQSASAMRRANTESSAQNLVVGEAEEEFPWTPFQSDLSAVRPASEAVPRFTNCEKIGVVLEGDANRPDMRAEALMWVDFLEDQGYCVAYFFDWARHASQAWSNKDIAMNFGIGWKDALREVKQSDEDQVIQIMNSTKENWMSFTSDLEQLCAKDGCAAKRVVMAFEDHGEYRLLGLPEHKKLMREDLLAGLRSLYRLSPDVKLLSYISACKSGSMFGGPQYSAKELLQSHYIDCDLRDDTCMQGPISSQVAVIAGHSVVGRQQRVLMRATEAIMEAQAMCDLAAGDMAGAAIISEQFKMLTEEQAEQIKQRFANLSSQDINAMEPDAKKVFKAMSAYFNGPPASREDPTWVAKIDAAMKEITSLSDVLEKWTFLVRTVRFGLAKAGAETWAMAQTLTPQQLEEYVQGILNSQPKEDADTEEDKEVFDVSAAMALVKEIDPSFELTMALPKATDDLRESSFVNAFNAKVLDAWFALRQLVNTWKASADGKPLWEELSNGGTRDAEVAKKAEYEVPWGVDCGTLANCLETFGRAQVFAKLHDKEIGCGGGAKARWEGHQLASTQSDGEGIEENGGLESSGTAVVLTNLLRALSYTPIEQLEQWDGDMKAFNGKLGTGDFEYADDTMYGAAMTENEPLDLMIDLDGEATRAESVLAFSASVPQIISSSLLPFTVNSIQDIKDRLKDKADGNAEVDSRFRAHVRTVEDLAINQDSMHMDMMFGLYATFLKMMMKAKGNEDATISITEKDSAARAEEFERLAETSWFFKKSKERKAEFYGNISEGVLPEGFLSFSYVSPATNRKITRYFDTMLSSENFGSPIAFGNMLDTDLTEFFHHVPSNMEKLGKFMAGIGDDILGFMRTSGDWFVKISEPRNQLSDEEARCCCKSETHCELLVGDELKKSRNPFKWGKAVCPSDLGYQHYARFDMTEKPASCLQ